MSVEKGTRALKYLTYICCCVLLALFLVACSDSSPTPANNGPTDTPATNIQSTPLPSITASGSFREYPLPQKDSGMMRPAIDHEGRIWFGEMDKNYLAVFDPRTGTF